MEDPGSSAEWEIWYQDTFDWDCPRQVQVSGRGLVAGLLSLWMRHLSEAVALNGQRGFSRFNLWWKQERKSIEVVGPWGGLMRLRAWALGKDQESRHGLGNHDVGSLLQRIARVHAYLVLAGDTSAPILAVSERSASPEDFEEELLHLELDALRRAG